MAPPAMGASSSTAPSPSGDWPSSPVGFERDWPPGEGQGQPVVLAFGGNIGDRVGHFRTGLRLLRQAGIVVERHACLYETAPAYLTEQPHFLNSAVQARTVLPPLELLRVLKDIEEFAGRDFGTVRNGPRPLDLDILFYGDPPVTVETEALQIPHPRMAERPFVLAPLLDLLGEEEQGPGAWAQHPILRGDLRKLWASLGGEALLGSEDMRRMLPLPCLSEAGQGHPHGTLAHAADGSEGGKAGAPSPSGPLPLAGTPFWSRTAQGTRSTTPVLQPGRGRGHRQQQRMWRVGGVERPLVMGILNVTPDSFSDGGSYGSVADAVARAGEMAREGAEIIDVGGQSTRPGATMLSTDEELSRVVPVIRALTASSALAGVSISVDTFDSAVAAAAVAAGAHIVNDVSGGTLDKQMFHTVAGLEVPYVLMHMRGDPTTMTSKDCTTYKDVIADVAAELAQQAAKAELGGIAAWQLVLDPGIGFAKTPEQSLAIVQNLGRLRDELGRQRGSLRHMPLLLGPSRKRFLARIAPRATEAADRDYASCAMAAACVVHGADVIRMHNVKAGRDAADVACAVWNLRPLFRK